MPSHVDKVLKEFIDRFKWDSVAQAVTDKVRFDIEFLKIKIEARAKDKLSHDGTNWSTPLFHLTDKLAADLEGFKYRDGNSQEITLNKNQAFKEISAFHDRLVKAIELDKQEAERNVSLVPVRDVEKGEAWMARIKAQAHGAVRQ